MFGYGHGYVFSMPVWWGVMKLDLCDLSHLNTHIHNIYKTVGKLPMTFPGSYFLGIKSKFWQTIICTECLKIWLYIFVTVKIWKENQD